MNDQLKVFIQVAASGSFSKAAEKLYISPTAVMKQMNALEKEVGVPLFRRTNHGVELTEAGKSFNKDAAFMLQYCQQTLIRTRQLSQKNKHIIRVGTSLLNPCKALLDIWNKTSQLYPQFEIKIVPFEDDSFTLPDTYRSLGKDLDLIFGPCIADNLKDYFRVLKLGTYRFSFAVSRKHPLASKEALTVTDLYGEKLVIVKGGDSEVIQNIYDFLIKNHPQINVKEIQRYFDIEIFNGCAQSHAVLLTLDTWANIHPSVVTIPCDLDFSMPYGLLYSVNPSEYVKQFIEIIKEMQDMKD